MFKGLSSRVNINSTSASSPCRTVETFSLLSLLATESRIVIALSGERGQVPDSHLLPSFFFSNLSSSDAHSLKGSSQMPSDSFVCFCPVSSGVLRADGGRSQTRLLLSS